MAHSAEVKQKLRSAYVYKRLSLRAAADHAGVNYNTARLWKKKADEGGDNWDKARSASRIAEGGLGDVTVQVLEDFALLFQATIDELNQGKYDGLKKAEAISRLSDAYTKTMKAASVGNPEIAKLSIAMEVIKTLAQFISERYPDDLARFAQILEPFGQHIAKALK